MEFAGIKFVGEPERKTDLIRVEAGSVSLDACEIVVSGETRAIHQTGGRVEIKESALFSDELSADAIIYSKNGRLALKNSELGYRRGEGVALILKNLDEAVLEDVKISCGEGMVTTGIHTLDSRIVVSGLRIDAGKGTMASMGIKGDGGTARIKDLTVGLAADAYISTGISYIGGRLELEKAKIVLSGRYGATGLFCKNCVVEMKNSVFEGSTSEDFLYFFQSENSRLVVSTSHFIGGKTGDFIGAILQSTYSEWNGNTVTLGTGKVAAQGFYLKGDSLAVFSNNHIKGSGKESILFRIHRDTEKVRIENNKLTDAGLLLMAEDPSGGWSRIPAMIRIRTTEELNALTRGQGIFTGNLSD